MLQNNWSGGLCLFNSSLLWLNVFQSKGSINCFGFGPAFSVIYLSSSSSYLKETKESQAFYWRVFLPGRAALVAKHCDCLLLKAFCIELFSALQLGFQRQFCIGSVHILYRCKHGFSSQIQYLRYNNRCLQASVTMMPDMHVSWFYRSNLNCQRPRQRPSMQSKQMNLACLQYPSGPKRCLLEHKWLRVRVSVLFSVDPNNFSCLGQFPLDIFS